MAGLRNGQARKGLRCSPAMLCCLALVLGVVLITPAVSHAARAGQPAPPAPGTELVDRVLQLLCNLTRLHPLCATTTTTSPPPPTSTTTPVDPPTSLPSTGPGAAGSRLPPAAPGTTGLTAPPSPPVAAPEAPGLATTSSVPAQQPSGAGPERSGASVAAAGRNLRLLTPAEVDLSPGAIAVAAGISIIGMILLGFPAELFNNTLQANYGRLRRVLPWIVPQAAGDRPLRAQFVALAASCAVAGLIGSFQKVYAWSLDTAIVVTVAIGLGFFVTVAVFELAGAVAGARMGLARRSFRAYGGALPIVALFVGVSALGRLEPAYVYGNLAGCRWRDEDLPPLRERALQMTVSCVALLVVAVAAWAARAVVTGRVVTDLLAGVTIVGLNRLAFGLIPATFLAGHVVAAYRRSLWVSLFVPTETVFVLLVLLPIAKDAPGRVLAVSVVLFVLFAGLSLGVWAAFRRSAGPGERPLPARPASRSRRGA